MDIDTLYAAFQTKEQALKDALGRCAAEQAEGRTGLTAWKEADALNRELQALANELNQRLNDALAELNRPAA